jgi:acetyl-CoA carboxylase biotin carboxylase subunit
MLRKVLIANRGEIAVRIQKTLRKLGIKSVAVYSDPDTGALHATNADEAYALEGTRSVDTYLNIPKLIAIAQKSGADAIHPGYGFLSENAGFAQACADAGIVFIGPSPHAIRAMGDKIGARNILKNQDVPLVPGTEEPLSDTSKLKGLAEKFGYPVLLKAAAGGGGKGMRVVRRSEELEESLAAAQRESKNAFGDDRVFLEKYIENPRHIEIQILADRHGNTIHLFERECSLQRRHQKVIEETPSVALTPELREKMGATAVAIAKLIQYENAGTVEFILDPQGNYYFLEVNTRLQVEHPVTEMVTGIDLVEAQIRVAEGLPLAVARRQTGHAIECRIYAEDPEKNFMPSIGKITELIEPRGEGVRVDSGIFAGWTIPMEYDPMLAKLIVHAPTRPQATMKMIEALTAYKIGGIKTNIPFLIDLLRHPTFYEGRTETGVIEKYFSDWLPGAMVAEDPMTPWRDQSGWRLGAEARVDDAWRQELQALRKKDFESAHGGGAVHGASEATAPMPGTVTKVFVKDGEKVTRGQVVLTLEAMKMEHAITASRDGAVAKVLFKVADKVAMGDKLFEMAEIAEKAKT